MNACLSPCGTWRYALERSFIFGHGTVLFVMLNPSTADALTDDPTIRRCMAFAQGWGFARMVVGNLSAFRSTSPAGLWHQPIGPECDAHLRTMAKGATLIVCAWGANAHTERERQVIDLLQACGELHHLGLTKDGHPRHPLYLPRETKPQPWALDSAATA